MINLLKVWMLRFISIIVLFLMSSIGWGQCPGDGLTGGSFSGWTRKIGQRNWGPTIDAVDTPFSYPNTGGTRFVYLADTNARDPYTDNLLRVVPPGMSYSIRVGDLDDGAKAERMFKSFVVSDETALFTFHFAAVSERPTHPEDRQPIFGARIRDQNDSTIFCTDIRYMPGFTSFPTKTFEYDNGTQYPTEIRWADWQKISLDLRPYIGQIVTIEVVNGDCGLGQHFSYGYFAIECNPARFSYQWCMKDDPLVLIAPPGFEEYIWNNGDLDDTASYYSMNEGDSIVCQLISNFGCESELATELKGSDVTAQFGMQFDTSLIAAVFNNTSFTYQSNLDSIWWDFGDGNGSSQFNPIHQYDTFGIFDITLYAFNDSGCVDSFSRSFTYYPPSYPSFYLEDTCGLTAQFIDTSKPPVVGEITGYRWSFGDGGTSTLPSPSHTYAKGGKYKVRLITISNDVKLDTFEDIIRVFPFPRPDFFDEPACVDNPTLFQDLSEIDLGEIVSWSWRFNEGLLGDSTTEWVMFPEPGILPVRLTVVSDANCAATIEKDVEVYPETVRAAFDFEPERIEVLEPYAQYWDRSVNPVQWRWFADGESFSTKQNPYVVYPRDTATMEVRLQVLNRFGCEDDTVRKVVVEPIYALYIPNAYSPNGNGLNDGFAIRGEGIQEVLMIVRDRWGQEVCRIDALNTPVDLLEFVVEPQTVFNYEVYVVDKNGREDFRTGSIIVVR